MGRRLRLALLLRRVRVGVLVADALEGEEDGRSCAGMLFLSSPGACARGWIGG